MSILRTYKQALLALVALALAVAVVGLAPGHAWAGVASGALGINMDVPSTIEQRPSAPTGTPSGSTGVLGVNVQVPDKTTNPPDAGTPSQAGSAGAALGINLSVPPTIEQAAGSDKTGGASAVLGVNLQVPDPAAPDPENPDGPGIITNDKASSAQAVLGINLSVPSTAQQVTGEAGGSESVLGVNLKVPVTEMITFYANGGQGVYNVHLVPGKEVERPEDSRFAWPGHHIVGWYVDAACTGDPVQFPLTDDVLSRHTSFYAKWAADEPRVIGGVELHLVEHEFTDDAGAVKGNETLITDEERASHGIVGDGAQPDGYMAAGTDDAGAPVYEGRYYVGGDSAEWPDGTGADAGVLDAGTLVLPVPTMKGSADGMRDGWFDGWYKTCDPVVDASGAAVLDDTGYPVYRYSNPVKKVGEAWVIDRFDEGTGEPAYTQTLYAKWSTGQKQTVTLHANEGAWADGAIERSLTVKRGERLPESLVEQPTREGYTFHSWRQGSPEGSVWSFATPVLHDTDLYASWSRVEHVVTFDPAGGSAVADRRVPHGECVAEPATARPGYAFEGWYLDADGDGAVGEGEGLYDFATPVTAPIALVAKWREEGPEPVVEYEVRFVVAGDGATSFPPQTVRYGHAATRPADPDPREGYAFRGWFADEACTQEWDFLTPVTEACVDENGVMTLYARWEEDGPEPPDWKLDVTVPVSVGFAVDAETGEVATPDMGAYAIKSRTARPVAVERLDLETDEEEFGGLFSLKGDMASWKDAFEGTAFLFRSAADGAGLSVPLADGDAAGPLWAGSYILGDEEKAAHYTIGAFSYEGGAGEEEWWETDSCNRLDLKLGMELSDLLAVDQSADGEQKITHLKVTVSARE